MTRFGTFASAEAYAARMDAQEETYRQQVERAHKTAYAAAKACYTLAGVSSATYGEAIESADRIWNNCLFHLRNQVREDHDMALHWVKMGL